LPAVALHEVVDERVDGLGCVVLVSHAADLRAGFASQAGMVGYSLRHRGDELLGQRGGLSAYRRSGSSFGIPLLHPWANRLSSRSYSASGREALLDPEVSPVRLDPNGLPIHGLLTASRYWELESRIACAERAAICARLDFGAHEELLAAFPFPHELRVEVELALDTLTVATTLVATGDVGVPVSFGWHPYLRLPGVPREEWTIELAGKTRALLDESGIPTGGEEPAEVSPGPLGGRGYDDLFTALTEPPRFALEGGGRRIELEFGDGFPMAQVYAPPEEQFICFEPMTAPTDALVSGHRLRSVAPGDSFRAEFLLRLR
jgi:galactose mutarotase-like enzyme